LGLQETVNQTRYTILKSFNVTPEPKRKLGDIGILIDALKILKVLYGNKVDATFYPRYTKTAEAFFSMPYPYDLQRTLGFPSMNA
jgi:hypothetical protein